MNEEYDDYYEPTCDEYSHFLGFSNDEERDNWIDSFHKRTAVEAEQAMLDGNF